MAPYGKFLRYLWFHLQDLLASRGKIFPSHDLHRDAGSGLTHGLIILIKHEAHFSPALSCHQRTALPQSAALDDGSGNRPVETQQLMG